MKGTDMAIYTISYSNDKPHEKPFARHLGEDAVNHRRIDWDKVPNKKQLTPQQFWHHMGIYAPSLIFSAGHVRIDGATASVQFYHGMDSRDVLYAVVKFFSGRDDIEFYQVSACQHQYKEKRLGNCYHEYRCIHCDHSYTVDSSD